MRWSIVGRVFPVLLASTACRDLSDFSTRDDRYQGPVVQADFVRAGVAATVELCLTFDTNHIEDGPGTISTSDGVFQASPLRPIPQLWHDPLSTLSFGEGRTRNLLYVAAAAADGGGPGDVVTVVSLMDSGKVEVRLLRGAPVVPTDGGSATGSGPANLFAIFTLDRQKGPCPF